MQHPLSMEADGRCHGPIPYPTAATATPQQHRLPTNPASLSFFLFFLLSLRPLFPLPTLVPSFTPTLFLIQQAPS